jgi:hypothetical protein
MQENTEFLEFCCFLTAEFKELGEDPDNYLESSGERS